MVIFNQTFKSDQKVIFPDNWHTGKTVLEQFEQTRRSMPWLIASTIVELVIAFLWILLLFVTAKGLYELWKVWKEPQTSPRRRQYRKILKNESLLPILAIAVSLFTLTAVLFVRVMWIREDLLRGGAFWVVLLVLRRAYRIFRPAK